MKCFWWQDRLRSDPHQIARANYLLGAARVRSNDFGGLKARTSSDASALPVKNVQIEARESNELHVFDLIVGIGFVAVIVTHQLALAPRA